MSNQVDFKLMSDICNDISRYNTKHAISHKKILHEETQNFFYPLAKFAYFERIFDTTILPDIVKVGFLNFLNTNTINKVNYAVSYLVHNVSEKRKNKDFGFEIKRSYENSRNLFKEHYNIKKIELSTCSFRITKDLYKSVLELCDTLDVAKDYLYFLALEVLVIDIKTKNRKTDLFTRKPIKKVVF
jgi:hypothetical protein